MNNGDRALVLAVVVLGVSVVLSIVGSIALAAIQRTIPANLTPTATGAVGALSVILGQQLAQRANGKINGKGLVVQLTPEQLDDLAAKVEQRKAS